MEHPKIIIRECLTSDSAAIFELNKNEMGYDYPIEQTERKLRLLLSKPENKIFVAECDEKVIAYVHANDYDVIYAPHMKNIMGIAVCENYKHLGIGKALLTAVEDWAKVSGAAGVRLVSGASRTGAHEFYRRCGYGGDKKQINFKKIF